MAIATTAFLSLVALCTAEAQTLGLPRPFENDRVRVGAAFYAGKVTGAVGVEAFGGAREFAIKNDLGVDDRGLGPYFEVSAGLARRHRVCWGFSRMRNTGAADFSVAIPVPPGTLSVASVTEISLSETRFFYNYLFVARDIVDVGVIGGVGYFNNDVLIATDVGDAAETLAHAYPVVGANMLFNPGGDERIYLEFAGFPTIDVGDLSGNQLDLTGRIDMYPWENYGMTFGFRYYRLSFADVDGTSIKLAWGSLIIGGTVRF